MPVDTHEDIMPAAGIEGPNVVETHEDIQPAMGMEAASDDAADQEFNSAKTSRNQVPALFNHSALKEKSGSRNIDIGGGRFDKGTQYLADTHGIDSKVFDPFNRSKEHNDAVHEEFSQNPADTATIANVLNVIKEPSHRRQVINNAHKYLKDDGEAYFSVYEGDGSGSGRATRDGWQENRKLASYLPEIQSLFPNAKISGGAIVARKSIAKAYGGAIAGPKLTEENAEDFARRLILWSYAAAPFVDRSIRRATGGEVDPSVDQALAAARGASQADPAASATETARSLTPMGFYSAAAEAASKIPQRAPIDQILNKVKGSPGVKAEELDWSGVKDAFSGQRSVDPQEVARHFQTALPALQETVKYDPLDIARKLSDQRAGLMFQGRRGSEEDEALKDKITQTYNPSWRRENAAVYGQYTLPDGANYREVLLHLPVKDRKFNFKNVTEMQTLHDAALRDGDYQKANEISKEWEGMQTNNYQSTHWNVPNVVAHLRLSDRDMGKTLHMEELQSDWGQEGRDGGFQKHVNPDEIKRLSAIRDNALNDLQESHKETLKKYYEWEDAQFSKYDDPEIQKKWMMTPEDVKQFRDDASFIRSKPVSEQMNFFGNFIENSEPPTRKLFADVVNRNVALEDRYKNAERSLAQLNIKTGVPLAPNVTSNEGWTDLGLKRALLEAAKGGYNELVWTPGQEQADRYDLSQQVKHIMWSPDNKILSALTHDNSEAIGEQVEKEDLHKYIGKEAAKKLLDQEPEMDGNMATHHLRGQAISVGGEGMKNYYDRFLPGRLQKLISKMDPEAKIQLHGHRMFVPDEREGDSEEGEYKNVHSLKITPKLRAAILKGLPAYKSGGSIVNKALDVVSGLRR